MEQIDRETTQKRGFTLWHAPGLLLILCTALAVWFGVHPRYRVLCAGFAVLFALAAWKRDRMYWIVLAAEAVFIAFLWTFPQAGYRIASAVPLAIVLLITVFRFGKKPLKIVVSILSGVALCALLVLLVPIVRATTEKPEPDADYIIVLGAGVYGETPSITLEHRLEGALRYLDANPRTKAVVSGGQGAGEDISEAECMRRWLTEHGVDPDRILTEDRSTSTKENLAFSKAAIEADGGTAERVVIVTSPYHMYRAKQIAAKLGIRADCAAGSDGYPIYMLGMYLREAAATLKLWVFGA